MFFIFQQPLEKYSINHSGSFIDNTMQSIIMIMYYTYYFIVAMHNDSGIYVGRHDVIDLKWNFSFDVRLFKSKRKGEILK